MYNIRKKPIHKRAKLDTLDILIKEVIELNNKVYKLVIKICYNKTNSKVKVHYKYISYYNT